MLKAKFAFVVFILGLLPFVAGCSHKLIAHNGETTVDIYSNKDQFDKVQSMKSQGGPAALLGGLGESMLAKKVAADTPIKVLSNDDRGSTVEVLDGPAKGLQGYVANDNVD